MCEELVPAQEGALQGSGIERGTAVQPVHHQEAIAALDTRGAS